LFQTKDQYLAHLKVKEILCMKRLEKELFLADTQKFYKKKQRSFIFKVVKES